MQQQDFEQVLAGIGKGSLEVFRKLRPMARGYFLALAEPVLRGAGDEASLRALYSVDYERVPVTPEVFLNHADYCGHIGQDDFFPAWRAPFYKACDPAGGTYEIMATGAQGLGKTTFAMLVLAYKLYRLSCLRDPARFYGLQARSKVVFGLYALTRRLVKDVGFYDLRDKIMEGSPYFRDVFRRIPHGKEFIRWEAKPLEVITGSSELHALGQNLFAVAADELNYYAQGEKTAVKAHELVAEVSRRLESRFADGGGDIPGVAIYISQTRTQSDYLEQRIRDKQGQPGVMVIRGPRWSYSTKGYKEITRLYRENPEVYEGTPTTETSIGRAPAFRLFAGSEIQDPRVLDTVARRPDGHYEVRPRNPEDRPDGRILHVPVTHYRAFLDDIHGSMRVIADEPTGSFTPFFSRREIVEGMFDPALAFPFTGQKVPCYEGTTFKLQSVFGHEMVTNVHLGKHLPLRHPSAPRYIHLDLSQTQDCTGMAMVHPSGHYVDDREDDEDGAEVGEGEAIKEVEVDFYVALTAGPYGEPIDYQKVRVFIDWLRRIGYWIRKVTADSYQSADMLQRLREMGFDTDVLSVDRTSQPYANLRQASNEHRIKAPFPPEAHPRDWGSIEEALRHVTLYQEITGLEHDVRRDKVDHREKNPDGSKGSKDIADGLCGATFACLVDKVAFGEHPSKIGFHQQVAKKYNRYLDAVDF